jgi:hypothetical protein
MPRLIGAPRPTNTKSSSRSLVTASNARTPGHLLRTIVPVALNLLQALATTVLATLTLSRGTPGPMQDCALHTTWQGLWTTHNAEAIKAVQEALSCCGFHTVKHMAWPFPGAPGAPCAERYGRTLSCEEPWRALLQRNAGIGTGVLVTVGIVQVHRPSAAISTRS